MDRVDAAGGMAEAVRPDKTLTKPVQGLAAISMRIGTPEVRKQKLKEGQEIAEAVLDAEVRIGELMREVPKATKGNQYTGKMISNTDVTHQTKADVIESMGFNKMQVQRFETLAAHPEAVERAKAEGFASAILPTAGQNYKKDGY